MEDELDAIARPDLLPSKSFARGLREAQRILQQNTEMIDGSIWRMRPDIGTSFCYHRIFEMILIDYLRFPLLERRFTLLDMSFPGGRRLEAISIGIRPSTRRTVVMIQALINICLTPALCAPQFPQGTRRR